MFALAQVTEQFLQSLPAEFTKKDFDSARKVFDGHPLSLQTCRDYGFVVISRTEPTTYTKEESVWVDVKGRKYNEEEMELFDRRAIANLFDRPDYVSKWGSIYSLPYHDEPVEHACERNIFRFNVEKFKRFLEENA
jgi:hypothetical protein